jgi:hypothetical protein
VLLLAVPVLLIVFGVAWAPIVIAVAGAAATVTAGLIAYLTGKRITSGHVGTSDAATLWKASEQIRAELRAQVVDQRQEIADLRGRVVHLEAEVERLRREVGSV